MKTENSYYGRVIGPDFYSQELHERYLDFVIDPQAVGNTLRDIRDQASKGLEARAALDQLGHSFNGGYYRPLGNDPHFPGNYVCNIKGIPANVARALEKIANDDPQRLLFMGLPGKEVNFEEYKDVYIGCLSAILRTDFFINYSPATELMVEMVKELVRVAESLREALSAEFYLHEAAKVIGILAPKLRESVEGIANQTILIRENGKPFVLGPRSPLTAAQADIDSIMEDWGAMVSRQFPAHYFIRINDGAMMDNFFEDRQLRVLLMAHELMHLYVFSLLNEYSPIGKPGTSTPNTDDQFTVRQEGRDIFIPQVTIERVIQEAMSLAVEHEFLMWLKRGKGVPDDIAAEMQKYGDERLRYLRRSNYLWQTKHRELFRGEAIPTHQYTQLAYSEGAMLSISLRRHGWTLNDIPEFLRKATALVQQQAGQTGILAFNNFPIERSKTVKKKWRGSFVKNKKVADSPYKLVLRKIRTITKDHAII